jgi:uncharacterized protein (TIGR03503 family)
MKIVQLGLLLTALIIANSVVAVRADQTELSEAALIPDVRVIIDISGSMKNNDPNNLRRPALELLVKLLPDGAKAGVWTFGQWVNNLVPSGIVDSQWRENAFAKAASINSVALRTNIPAALLKALDDINTLDPAYQVHVILLTDGMVDVSASAAENQQARQRILEQIMPAMRDAGVNLHTVALSQNADQQLMELLATETNGLAAVAETAEDLTGIFLQAFDAAVAAEQVPLEGNTFSVDASIDEFTALVFRQPDTAGATLLAPDGKTYSAAQHPAQFSWFSQPLYDLVTVKKPLPGLWSINAQLQPGSRVTIVSDLGLKVNGLAKSLFTDNSLELVAALNEDGTIITRAEFLNLVDMSVQVLRRDDGQQWQQSLSELNPIPDDGMFSDQLQLFQQPGVYDVIVAANGKTFQRQFKQTIAVRERYDLRVATLAGEPPAYRVTVRARDSAIDGSNTTVTGALSLPAGGSQTIETEQLANRSWVAELEGLSQSGVYQLGFTASGKSNNGEPFTEQTATVNIEHRVVGSPFIEAPAEPIAEPVTEPPAEAEPKIAAVTEKTPETSALPEPAQPAESIDEPEADSKLLLYAGLAVANLIVFGLAFFAYRMVTSANKEDVLDEEASEQVSEVAADEPPAPLEAVISEAQVEPEAELELESEAEAEPEPEPELNISAEQSETKVEDDDADEIEIDVLTDLGQPIDLDDDLELDVEPEPEPEQPLVDLDLLEDEVMAAVDIPEQAPSEPQLSNQLPLADSDSEAVLDLLEEEQQLELDENFDLDMDLLDTSDDSDTDKPDKS